MEKKETVLNKLKHEKSVINNSIYIFFRKVTGIRTTTQHYRHQHYNTSEGLDVLSVVYK